MSRDRRAVAVAVAALLLAIVWVLFGVAWLTPDGAWHIGFVTSDNELVRLCLYPQHGCGW